jgi:outer membrane protein OmpA-like peptidoglycan-associated protein
VPEDADGFQDGDGCDDPDNDRDGIPDVIDQCALEPETINGNKDEDGCQDAGDSLVMVMPDRIELLEPIRFRGATTKLLSRSTKVLAQVAATLRANREFLRVRIGVHVHTRGAGDQALSEQRAEVVREWLVKWGIETDRLEAKGFGATRPLQDRGGAAVNDRVELVIIERKLDR